jgi:hypothetical protein
VEVGLKREEEKGGLGAWLVGWLVGWLVYWLVGWSRVSGVRNPPGVPVVPISHHRYLTKERMLERLVGGADRLRDSHSGPRLSQTQNSHWKRDERLLGGVERLRDSHSEPRLSQTQNSHWKRG